MLGTLLTGPSIRRLGARGHTVAATTSSAAASLVLGQATSNAVAFSGVLPMALGAGKGQATSARITNLGEELRVPQGVLAEMRGCFDQVLERLEARAKLREFLENGMRNLGRSHARV